MCERSGGRAALEERSAARRGRFRVKTRDEASVGFCALCVEGRLAPNLRGEPHFGHPMKPPLLRIILPLVALGLAARAADETPPAYPEILKVDSHSHVFED